MKWGWSEMPFFGSMKHCVWVLIYFYTGLLPFVKIDCDSFGFTYFFESMPILMIKNPLPSWIVILIKKIMDLTFKFMIRHLQKRNIPVIFWTVNTENDVKVCINFNANAIVCDNPKVLLEYIKFNFT